jgi:predicted ATPase
MRIAVSGSHGTGKSTLVQELADRLPDFTAIDEPYYRLAAEGHAFSEPPTYDDFSLLFERALALVNQPSSHDLLFDRSPADYLAYLSALEPGAISREQVTQSGAAMATIDVVVFVPIEQPERIAGVEAPQLRRRVDRILREMLVEDAWGFGVRILSVHGTPRERVDQVLAYRGRAIRPARVLGE